MPHAALGNSGRQGVSYVNMNSEWNQRAEQLQVARSRLSPLPHLPDVRVAVTRATDQELVVWAGAGFDVKGWILVPAEDGHCEKKKKKIKAPHNAQLWVRLRKEGWSYRLFLPIHICSRESGCIAPLLWGSSGRKFLLFTWSPSGFPNEATALSTVFGSGGSFMKALAWPISRASQYTPWAAPLPWLWFLVPSSLSCHYQPRCINTSNHAENIARAFFHPGSNKGICCSVLLLPASLFRQ